MSREEHMILSDAISTAILLEKKLIHTRILLGIASALCIILGVLAYG